MPLEIVSVGDPVLRQRAREVSEEELASAGFRRFVKELVETMRSAHGAGLAAPQVGRSLRVFAVEVADNPRYPYKPNIPLHVLLNPEVRPLSAETFEVVEGCLSVPDLRGRLRRFAEVEVSWTTLDGERVSEVVRGVSAGTFQHEQDHLDGILFLDRVDDPRTFMTWEAFQRHHEAAFAAEARAIVERWGS